MKILYLLRHAHAEPRETSLSDYDRPLDEQGQSEAEAVASYLQNKKITFDFVMCSSALRTQETLEPLRPHLGTDAIEISEDFYNSSEDRILRHLQRISNKWERVLYIGHNPGIAFTALKFAKVFPQSLMEGVAPAVLIGFQSSINKWEDLTWGQGEVIEVFQPNLSSQKPPSPMGL